MNLNSKRGRGFNLPFRKKKIRKGKEDLPLQEKGYLERCLPALFYERRERRGISSSFEGRKKETEEELFFLEKEKVNLIISSGKES